MDRTALHPDIELLRRFIPLQALSRDQLKLVARSVRVEKASADETLIKRGSSDDNCFFLIEGRLKLTADDGKQNELDAGDASAR